jgi:hypothetical protein
MKDIVGIKLIEVSTPQRLKGAETKSGITVYFSKSTSQSAMRWIKNKETSRFRISFF